MRSPIPARCEIEIVARFGFKFYGRYMYEYSACNLGNLDRLPQPATRGDGDGMTLG